MSSKNTYSVVVEDGSYVRVPNSNWRGEREHCGHKHRTIDAALRCMERLTKNRSTQWYNATVHNQDHEPVDSAAYLDAQERVMQSLVR
jgi:hypothetical protein